MRGTAALACAVGATALAAAAAGCGDSSPDPAAVTEDRAKSLSRAVVYIEGVYREKTTQATGVVFEARQGLVLTANHAMENAPTINVRLANGTLTHARQVARAQCHDLAVLRLFPRPRGLAAIPLGHSGGSAVGEPVSTLTFLFSDQEGKKRALTRIDGTVSAVDVRESFPPLPRTGPFIAHQTSLLPVAGGSPLLDPKGRMIGLNTLVGHPHGTKVSGVEYALASDYIRRRLAQLRPGVGGALGGWGAEHSACHGTLHRLIGKGHIAVPNSAGGP
jgi:S1-C subfamily serine protease